MAMNLRIIYISRKFKCIIKTITHAPYLKPLIKQGRWMDDDLDLSFEPANPNAIDPLDVGDLI